MVIHDSFSRTLRVHRLYRHAGDRLLVVALDHSVTDGPFLRRQTLDGLIGQVCANGADAVVLHKGSLRHVRPQWFHDTGLIVHLSASTSRAPDPDAKYLVASVEEALGLGADGVSVHVNLGSAQESRQIADLATVGAACDRWGLPLLAMVYPRGPKVEDPQDPQLVAHAVTLAADLGADIVKTTFPGSVAALAQITRDCAIPVLVSGGARCAAPGAFLSRVCDALRGGATGVAVGRNIFEAANPGAMTHQLADLVHGRPEPTLTSKELAHEVVLG